MGLVRWCLVGAVAVGSFPLRGAEDWRVELLAEEGVGSSASELRRVAKEFSKSAAELEVALGALGDPDYPTREDAQRALIAGGSASLKLINGMKIAADPEVQRRLGEVRLQLEDPLVEERGEVVAFAAKSLLSEVGKPIGASTGRMFYEWFGEESREIDDGYRVLKFEAKAGMEAKVRNGRLVMSRKLEGQGDQSLVLYASQWPKRKDFPGRFKVSAKLGGTEGANGSWNVGISVGLVRVLYHPGYAGGGFRFQRRGRANYLTKNADMGFTPATDRLQRMSVEVTRLRGGSVRLDVRVDQGRIGEQLYERSLTVDAKTIGKFDRVSLDRSGAPGGEALFDEFCLDFRDW